VRESDDNWKTIELYLSERANLDVTHGICPDCRIDHYPPRKTGGSKSA
jgi:hypothetical protein